MATFKPSSQIKAPPRIEHDWAGYSLWLAAAAVLGFAVPAIFSGILELSRNWYLVPYFAVVVPFLYAYIQWTDIDVGRAIRHRWIWGVVGGAAVGAFMVMNIVNNETASPRPEGLELIGSMLWLGIGYGVVDALLLTVLPVSAVWLAFKAAGVTRKVLGKVLASAVALIASLLVTAVYHAGYVEFRDADLISPVFGNGVMSLGFLITANPLTAIIAHIALHVISVWHGIDTTVTLPPHY